MTIIAMGDFRVKGMVNEQNMGSIMEGQPVLIHSRVDEDVVWKGTMGKVDTENPGNDNHHQGQQEGQDVGHGHGIQDGPMLRWASSLPPRPRQMLT